MSDVDGTTTPDGIPLPPEQTEEFVRAEHPWLVRYFRGRTHNPHDAQDLAQETILQFLRTAQTNAIRAPQHLLRKIASNLVGKHAERGSNRISRNSVPMIELFDRPTDITPAREAEGKEELGHWVGVINRLKPKTRDIFLMSRVDGYSYEEIADHYHMTIWGVKKHMIKAIAYIDRNRRNP